MSLDPEDRIIWSADLEDETALMKCLGDMHDLRMIKIDRNFTEGTDLTVLSRLSAMGLQVFDDAKIWEIPTKTLGIAGKHLKHKPWMLNCAANVCSSGNLFHADPDKVDGLKRFADACHAVGTRPCAVTVLTTKTPGLVMREYGGRTPTQQVLWYLDLLAEFGFTDVVCSANEVPIIRAESRFDYIDLNVPGIRPAGSAADDQARVNTPEAALADGATRLVIGRPITKGNPAENFRNIAAGLKATV